MNLRKRIEMPEVSPVYIGDRPASEMEMSLVACDSSAAQIVQLSNVDELDYYKKNSNMFWVNISGLKDVDSLKRLGELFDIHPLTIEDILNTEQQPKVEIFDEYSFLSVKTIQREKNLDKRPESARNIFSFLAGKKEQHGENDDFLIDQVSIIIMKNVLITFQEIPGDTFDGVRKKILENTEEIRRTRTDYLAYSIIDAVVDEYFLALDHLEDVIENFEDRATKTSDDKFIEEIQDTKKYLLQIKRAILPLKNNMLIISHHGLFFKADELKPFLQDLNDNLNNVITTVENNREWLTNIMEVNLSVLSHQMNKVMKVLATISTIFIPLTFIAGIYGMNFKFMPELEYNMGYFITLGGMGFVALTMIVIFKIHRWF
jgi:magnesium transporter